MTPTPAMFYDLELHNYTHMLGISLSGKYKYILLEVAKKKQKRVSLQESMTAEVMNVLCEKSI